MFKVLNLLCGILKFQILNTDNEADRFFLQKLIIQASTFIDRCICYLWSPYVIGRRYIFSCCFFFFFLFLSSPNLRGRRLDVYHTLAHGVALVRIQNAGLKCAARGSLQIQDAKNRHLGTIAQFCRAISSQLRHVSTIGKKLVKHQYLLYMS